MTGPVEQGTRPIEAPGAAGILAAPPAGPPIDHNAAPEGEQEPDNLFERRLREEQARDAARAAEAAAGAVAGAPPTGVQLWTSAAKGVPGAEDVARAQAEADRAAEARGQQAGNDPGQQAAALFRNIVSFRARQEAEIPPRVWFVEGMITTGFNMIAAKKAQGKSFLMMQLANAIAEGRELLGRKTLQAKVLYVSFELDEGDSGARFKEMLPLSENAHILHAWPSGESAALEAAELAVKELGYGVLLFDTFLPLLPKDKDFQLNEYADSDFFLKWRLLGKRNNAAVVASWHEGKTPREDFFLNPIGGTGMVAQADSLITIDRKRGHPEGRLFIGGNHAKDAVLPVVFGDSVFRLGDGACSPDRLSPDEEKTLTLLAKYPEGCTPTKVGLEMGKSDNAARATLNRLIARERVMKISRGVYGISTLLS